MAQQVDIFYCVPLGDMNILFWLVIGLMLMFVAVLFMLGRAMQRKEWEALARDELRQVIISAVIGIAVVGLASIFCYLSGIVMQDIAQGMTHFQYAKNYISFMVDGLGIPLIQTMYKYSYTCTILEIMGPATIFGGNLFSGLATVTVAVEKVNDMLFTPLVASLSIQQILLQAAEAFSITLFLPCGMILRAFRPTRVGGAFLISVAFGAFVVLPFTYVINYQITKQILPGFGTAQVVDTTSLEEAFSLKDPTKVLDFMNDVLFSYIDRGGLLAPQAIILPLVNLAIVTAFISTFTEFLKDLG
ncbi:MAG: hypothetical protein QW112_02900 [Candidatus Micrarchaeia archaeon]